MNKNIAIGVAVIIVVAIVVVAAIFVLHLNKVGGVAAGKPKYVDLLSKFNSTSFGADYTFHIRTLLVENNTIVANQSNIMYVAYNQSSGSFSISITQNGNTTTESASPINSSYYKVCITFTNGTQTCKPEPASSVSSPIYGILAVLNITQYNYTRTINVLGNNAYCYINGLNTTAPSVYGVEAVDASNMNCLYDSGGVPAYASFNLTEAIYPQGSVTPFAVQSSSVTAVINELHG